MSASPICPPLRLFNYSPTSPPCKCGFAINAFLTNLPKVKYDLFDICMVKSRIHTIIHDGNINITANILGNHGNITTTPFPHILSYTSALHDCVLFANHMEEQLKEEQFGFRKGKGTRDAIGLLRTICERYLEKNKEVYIISVDLEKAFDRR
ncbi:hypothetical protein ANN_19663 [Periplaneta americana]|uniref:Reverse transcriptase domain-containing protein n=1 Tax=Periplaneta americana TaxID=6978 RepID=A0ABQ8SBE8_PERAM|nr:hypothetical protein ANN_19663 [Periplaneta americana]